MHVWWWILKPNSLVKVNDHNGDRPCQMTSHSCGYLVLFSFNLHVGLHITIFSILLMQHHVDDVALMCTYFGGRGLWYRCSGLHLSHRSPLICIDPYKCNSVSYLFIGWVLEAYGLVTAMVTKLWCQEALDCMHLGLVLRLITRHVGDMSRLCSAHFFIKTSLS